MGLQLEDGYTKIANEILEQLARIKLNGTQYRILLVVLRYTYGYNRKQWELSRSFLSKATGVDKDRVGKEINKLVNMKILRVVAPPTFSKARVLGFNKYYTEWAGWEPEKETTADEKDHSSENTPVGEKDHSQYVNSHTPSGRISILPVGEKDHQQIKLKEKLNKNIYINAREGEQEIFALYENEVKAINSQTEQEQLAYIAAEYPPEWVKQAILIVGAKKERMKRNVKYLDGILQGWADQFSLNDKPWLDRDIPPDKCRGKPQNRLKGAEKYAEYD